MNIKALHILLTLLSLNDIKSLLEIANPASTSSTVNKNRKSSKPRELWDLELPQNSGIVKQVIILRDIVNNWDQTLKQQRRKLIRHES